MQDCNFIAQRGNFVPGIDGLPRKMELQQMFCCSTRKKSRKFFLFFFSSVRIVCVIFLCNVHAMHFCTQKLGEFMSILPYSKIFTIASDIFKHFFCVKFPLKIHLSYQYMFICMYVCADDETLSNEQITDICSAYVLQKKKSDRVRVTKIIDSSM